MNSLTSSPPRTTSQSQDQSYTILQMGTISAQKQRCEGFNKLPVKINEHTY